MPGICLVQEVAKWDVHLEVLLPKASDTLPSRAADD